MSVDDFIANAESNNLRIKILKVTKTQVYDFYLKLTSILGGYFVMRNLRLGRCNDRKD